MVSRMETIGKEASHHAITDGGNMHIIIDVDKMTDVVYRIGDDTYTLDLKRLVMDYGICNKSDKER